MVKKLTDLELEALWNEFSGVSLIDDKDCIEEAFYIFEAGTDRFEVWHWFDILHSKGVTWLSENIA